MRRAAWVGLAVGLGGVVLTGAAAAKPAGACVTCHKSATGSGLLLHTFQDWATSVHATRGVGCEACHGGDPAKTVKEAAHAALRNSGDPASPVYFTRIPETCGRCHAAELAAFTRSRHSKELQTTGKGPNCVTCHGAMANHVLDPHAMEQVCTVCHRRPTQAYAARLLLSAAGDQLDRLKAALAKSDPAKSAAQAAEYRTLLARRATAVVDWHTFNMPEIIDLSRDISRRAGAAVNELTLQKGAAR